MKSQHLKKLHTQAKLARKKAHAPYSGYQVGAALVTSKGTVFSGCNVENASFGATVCAERVAIQKAVSEGQKKITEIVVVTDATPPWAPCGMCRQVLLEFGTSQTLVHLANLEKVHSTHTLDELVPHAFNSEHLSK